MSNSNWTIESLRLSSLVQPPSGLLIVKDWLPHEQFHPLGTAIDKQPWSNVLTRRTQHYGGRYDYTQKKVIIDNDVLPMSSCPEIANLATLIQTKLQLPEPFNQCIVNEYLSGQCISAHTDALCFGPVICSISLGRSTIMTFTHTTSNGKYSVELKAGDLMILSGEARYQWKHETKAIRTGNYRRGSITFRTMKIET